MMVERHTSTHEFSEMAQQRIQLEEVRKHIEQLEQKLAKTEEEKASLWKRFSDFKMVCDAESDRDSTKIKNLEAALKVAEEYISRRVHLFQRAEQAQQQIKQIMERGE